MRRHLFLILALILTTTTVLIDNAVWADDAAQQTPAGKTLGGHRPPRELFTGKVVLLKDALKSRKITAFDEIKDQVVLETEKGQLIPIVPDWRGRAFFQDKRLRDRKVQLVGYRHKGVPYLQILMVFTFDKKGVRQYTDYWCDICSIPMYEIKPCDCCQAEIRLRFQPKPLPDYLQQKPGETKKPVPGKPSRNPSTDRSKSARKP